MPHGEVETPVFMPVGTVGAVKTMSPRDLEEAGAQIILANTYHLYLRPGEKTIKKSGGINKFMRYNRPVLTDSGGYQVFSLLAKISEEGVAFSSHLDGQRHFITAEKSIKIQEDLGADLIMAFDQCPPASDCSKKSEELVGQAVGRTHRWLIRCIRAKKRKDQALIPICQGGIFRDLREESARFINNLDLPANAIGGVSVGEEKKDIYEVTKWCTDILDGDKPRYLMGIGYPEDILEVISRGIDMFDCVLPTRLARHGTVWINSSARKAKSLMGLNRKYEQIDLRNSKYSRDLSCLDRECSCYTCQNGFSKAYLRHLIFQKEPLGIHLLTVHNLKFTFDLISEVKRLIRAGKF